MVPRRIGFLGFDGVTACHLVGPADTLAAAALDDGFGNRIPCYQICTIGLSSEKFRAESGVIFKAHKTLHTAPDLDTIVIPGGEGLRRNEVSVTRGLVVSQPVISVRCANFSYRC
jgi:putative intracellular protease/amidase